MGLHYRSTFFSHIFDGGYAGTHYAYTWSAMLEAAALAGSTSRAGRRARRASACATGLLARGAVVEPLAALRAITGREATVEPMLERRGLL